MDNSKAFSIEPWLTLGNVQAAEAFYKQAFAAIETYRLEDPGGGLVVRLSVNGAGFWVSGEANPNNKDNNPFSGSNLRLILIVDNPDAIFTQAIKAGATEISPVSEGHGWRVGRLQDPFGLHWEIGHQFSTK